MNRSIILLIILVMLLGLGMKGNADSNPQVSKTNVKKEYFEVITEKLIRPFSKQVSGIYLVVPSFEPEYALLLENENGKSSLKYRRFKKNLWYALKKDIIPETESTTIEISKESQSLIGSFFNKAYKLLLQNRNAPGLDGVTYYFMIPDSAKTQMMRAETWSPKDESESYRAIQQAEKIIRYIFDPKKNEKDLKIIIRD